MILLTGCYFCAMTGSYGIAFWLPTILKRLSGKSDLKVTLLAALPYHSRVRHPTGERLALRPNTRAPLARSDPCFPVRSGACIGGRLPYEPGGFAGTFIVAGGSFYGFQPVFWAVPTMFLSESAAAASIGLINAVGNLGGFVGPMVMGYLASRTHSFSPGLLYLVASLFVSGVLMLAVGRQHRQGQVRCRC